MSVYDFDVKDAQGNTVSMAEFKGKVLLIVNVASKCGFTPQYKGLQELMDEYKERPFTVIGFPCNQFLKQEPGSSTEVCSFAASRFKTTFPIMDKIEVNGKGAHPLYQHIKREKPGVCCTTSVKWNFTKFLVDAKGKVVGRYSPTTEPTSIKADIERLLKQQ
eukprot:EG_transcript_21143